MSLTHLNATPANPDKTVILGAGFVGAATARHLTAAGADCTALSSKDLDLLADGAADKLAGHLTPQTTLVIVSARAPVKNQQMLIENLQMLAPISEALAKVTPAHVVYVSSDAVYKDKDGPLDETSCAEPGSLHGVMHLAREVALADVVGETPFAVVRPSLLYGAGDPHNGYGPNRFRRLSNTGQTITLFGEGEERRDHIHIDDVGTLISRIIRQKSTGVLNITTGEVASFREIAEKANALAGGKSAIEGSPRVGEMPHNGYRPFDASATYAAFPDFKYLSIDEGLAKAQAEADKDGN
ncbi:dTDP-glucose 4,6-dehydratase [Candidatus Phaeomarinobacter ectocarpi]|uniref:dTDP-glucose 4,6-dehydratase n=1 Tax=Candidatus Phaeomarinibacter ectocarpi TaxID=1458461 RepID=X5MLB1_9HYPH|nr:SDR family oxidoreductase [Candidatus Phaeomarinobacter ectocarpi]CDO59345.1 dTDP-glucose 4,6-dehydratase [Candidatus Phaeomarinobacter ectocarpi]